MSWMRKKAKPPAMLPLTIRWCWELKYQGALFAIQQELGYGSQVASPISEGARLLSFSGLVVCLSIPFPWEGF